MPNTTGQTPAKLPRERDRDGKRFCRMCDDYLPLAAFPAGQRRYACRTHLWQRVGRPAKRKMLAKPQKRLLSRIHLAHIMSEPQRACKLCVHRLNV